jgi:hypothetical protein
MLNENKRPVPLDAQGLASAWTKVTNRVAEAVNSDDKLGGIADAELLGALSQAMIAMSQERAHAVRSARTGGAGLLLPR